MPTATALSMRRLVLRDELHELFRLRHDLYLRCGFRRVPDPSGLDIDAYDPHAEHLGIFQDARLVGAVRAIFPDRTTACAEFLTRAVESRARLLPTENSANLDAVLSPLRNAGHTVVEFSRTFTVPEVRGMGLGLQLVSAICALAWVHGARYGIGSCPLTHVSFYEQGGFRSIGEFVHPEIGLPSAALILDLAHMPAAARRMVEPMRMGVALRAVA